LPISAATPAGGRVAAALARDLDVVERGTGGVDLAEPAGVAAVHVDGRLETGPCTVGGRRAFPKGRVERIHPCAAEHTAPTRSGLPFGSARRVDARRAPRAGRRRGRGGRRPPPVAR